jgi:hypothetical protein
MGLDWLLDRVGFEVLKAVVMKSTIFWNITPCSPLSVMLATWFHAGFLLSLFFPPWRWRRYVPPKRRLTLNGLHGGISQKMVLFRLFDSLRYSLNWWIIQYLVIYGGIGVQVCGINSHDIFNKLSSTPIGSLCNLTTKLQPGYNSPNRDSHCVPPAYESDALLNAVWDKYSHPAVH